MFDATLYQVSKFSTFREALSKIESNHIGMIVVCDEQQRAIGVATDGDVRRKLLQGENLDSLITSCCNEKFVWVDQETPRETLLKQLDHQIRVLPVLDKHKRLVDIVTRNQLPLAQESKVYSRSRAPVRISFGGGGSDLTHYFAENGGAVINSTISLYSHATLRKREDSKIRIYSQDLNDSLEADCLRDVLDTNGPFALIKSLLKTVHPDFGFELYLYSDFPMNSGLGGSAVVSAAVLGCFNQFRQDKWDRHEIAELAYQAERIYMQIAGGWQDQYATVFGGFNFMEFRMQQNLVHPLRIPKEVILELEESLVLCDTKVAHNSGDIHRDQKQQMKAEDVKRQVQSNVDLTYKMRDYLLRGKLMDFGKALDHAWTLKRSMSKLITNNELDDIYNKAIAHGAIGGKLLGAGGGGFFLFFVPPFARHNVVNCLQETGLNVRPFKFEPDGVQAWSTRENTSNIEE